MLRSKRQQKRLLHLACGASLAAAVSVLAPSALAQAAEWRPELVVPPNDIFAPGEPIRLQLPPLPAEVQQTLALELDDFDVTGFAARDGNVLVLAPPQPLAYGSHRLRLVENAPDGSIVERGAWTLSVRKTAAFREAGLQSAVTVNGLRRIADDLPEPTPSRNQWNGAAQLQGALANGDWRFDAQADLIGNAERSQLPRGEAGSKIDLGTFLLNYQNGPLVARAGHHNVGPDSLIMSGFSRRGVSVGVQTEAGASATVFSLSTAEVIGFQQGFGVGDSENRTDGISVSFRPMKGETDALVVSATYLTGQGPSQSGSAGSGVAGDPTSVDGSATSVIADGTLLEKRVRVRGEYATSRFDFDGAGRDTDLDGVIDADLAPTRDDAYSALVTYQPWHDKRVRGKPIAWQLGMETRRLGTFFRSPANPIGAADRELVRGFTGVTWSGLDAQLSVGRERDNVEDQPLIARTETAQDALSLTYTPQIALEPDADGNPPAPPWYGQPTFNATWVDLDQDVIRAGSGLSAGPLNSVRTLALSAGSSYPTWSWSLGRTITRSENFPDQAPDTDGDETQFVANFRVRERLTLAPTLQYSAIDETDVPVVYGFPSRRLKTLTAGLDVGYAFSERWSTLVGYNLNRTDASDGSQDVRTSDVRANVSWIVVPANALRPGLTLALDGQYHDVDDRVTVSATQGQYQVFLRAAVSWLPSW